MMLLPNGCTCSEPTVYPPEWERGGAQLLKKKWYIQYWFRDPAFKEDWPNGMPKKVKGMNEFKTLAERREATKLLLQQTVQILKEGYNPIRKQIVRNADAGSNFDVDRYTPLPVALKKTVSQLKLPKTTKADMDSALRVIYKTINQTGYDTLFVGEVKTKHVIHILEAAYEINERYTDNTYNKYRTYLIMIFKRMVQIGVIDVNPMLQVEKKQVVKRIRQVLSEKERILVNNHLRSNYYTFWRLIQIFFHSGAREIELLAVRKEDVNLEKQCVKYTVKKGKRYAEVLRPIKNIALPLWRELYEQAEPGNYLFSVGLKPGEKSIIRDQLTRRWRTHVKEKLNITADLYSLKHLNTTETVELLNAKEAAKMNAHTSTAMVDRVYDVNKKSREFQQLRTINNPFVNEK